MGNNEQATKIAAATTREFLRRNRPPEGEDEVLGDIDIRTGETRALPGRTSLSDS